MQIVCKTAFYALLFPVTETFPKHLGDFKTPQGVNE